MRLEEEALRFAEEALSVENLGTPGLESSYDRVSLIWQYLGDKNRARQYLEIGLADTGSTSLFQTLRSNFYDQEARESDLIAAYQFIVPRIKESLKPYTDLASRGVKRIQLTHGINLEFLTQMEIINDYGYLLFELGDLEKAKEQFKFVFLLSDLLDQNPQRRTQKEFMAQSGEEITLHHCDNLFLEQRRRAMHGISEVLDLEDWFSNPRFYMHRSRERALAQAEHFLGKELGLPPYADMYKEPART